MRRVLVLLCAVAFSLPSALVFAQGGDDGKGSDDELLRRSQVGTLSYPGGPTNKAPLSTGYYLADNEQPSVGTPWAPTFTFLDTTGAEIREWRRILSGPKQRPATYWTTSPESEGHAYFRNPNNVNDSTNDAFAGPISIGFPFYYYGRKYDSFYVSTNGLVALSNRRYQYDELGRRVDYEPVSDNPTAKTANAVTDPVADDYGYRVVALNNSTAVNAGILNGTNGTFPQGTLKSVISPLWDNTEFSQYNPSIGGPDDFAKAYYRRDRPGNKLIIYWVNQSMWPGEVKAHPLGAIVPNFRGLRANVQVVLDRSDSSIQFNYRFPTTDQQNNASVWTIYGYNATIGIQSHDQEWSNYLTNNTVFVNGDPANTPKNALAIKFKQWKNVVQSLRVTFKVPSRFVPGQFLDLPPAQLVNNYELLLGHAILGVVRPVGIVQNMSSDIGPVNVTTQPIRFNVVFRVRDLVNTTSTPPYQRTASTRELYPLWGKLPGGGEGPSNTTTRPNTDTIVFDSYVTNQNVARQAGRFMAEVISTDFNPNGTRYYGQWPFDDTLGVRVFGIRRLEIPFMDTFDDYSRSPEDGDIPSVNRWVTIGTQVRDGEATTYNPPPPRGAAAEGRLASPVMHFDRKGHGGGFYFNNNGPGLFSGDTTISFPINVKQAIVRPIIAFSYQRSGRQANGYPRGFSDQVRFGPEHATYNTAKNNFFAANTQPDLLLVEFGEPSANGVDGITNIQEWFDASFGDRIGPLVWNNAPRWGAFGGGGYSDTIGKIIINEFDAGKDFEFHRAYIPIPERWWKSESASNWFRFRFREQSQMNGSLAAPPADDGDDFYVDNVMILEPDKPEIEVTTVRVDWPYTEAPASQARSIPLAVKIGNNGSTTANTFGVAMYVQNRSNAAPPGFYNYYRYRSIISIKAGADLVEQFPQWNAQECGSEFRPTDPLQTQTTQYRIWGRILPENSDRFNANDAQYLDFDLKLGPTFAYDDAGNDVAGASGIVGKGLNLVPPLPNSQAPDAGGTVPFGPAGGNISGTFAMQFRIQTRDTLRGYSAFFAGANQSPDHIQYSVYEGSSLSPNDPPPQLPIASSRVHALRGEGLVQGPRGPYNFDKFVTYVLDTPVVLEPGYYFASVAQLGETGLELGGDGSRMGQVTTIRSEGPPQGNGNVSMAAHPEMQRNIFWFEATTESGGWNPMLTQTNNPGFPHLNYFGLIPVSGIQTYTRGSWIPMIRPYFGAKASSACLVEPVELASFEVTTLSNALRLDWKTATETNNHGFYVERRAKDTEGNWADITFQQGAGTSNQPRQYNYVDESVVTNTTYQYRLRQEDRDGSVSYSGTKEGRINSAVAGSSNTLSQNTPNPFSTSTHITFSVVESGMVQLEINDVYGNVVRSFAVDVKGGSESEVVWDGRDAGGVLAPNGVYVYKLTGNGFSPLSRKLTIAR